jgi:hypothetical protein
MSALLAAAAAFSRSAFGLVVLASDADEPGEEPELVGALTAQAEQQQQVRVPPRAYLGLLQQPCSMHGIFVRPAGVL